MAATKPLPRLLTIPETSELLGCSENFVYSLIADGELTTVDISRTGSRKAKTRVPEDIARAFFARRTSKPLRAAG
jgi:excisionase family DNA binding protein